MKSRKVFSLLLAVVMLFSVMSISVSAEDPGKVYSGHVRHTLSDYGTVSETLFGVDLDIDESLFTCFDGGSTEWTSEITSVVAKYTTSNINGATVEIITGDYIADKEAFFAVFERQSADRDAIEAYNASLLEGQTAWKSADKVFIDVYFDISFVDPNVFGTLSYNVSINVMEPLDIDIPLIGDALSSAVAVPTTAELPGKIWNFPSVDTLTMTQRPHKNTYFDNEKFELSGVSFDITTKVATSNSETPTYAPASSGSVTYRTVDDEHGSANANMFTCTPSEKENLTVDTHTVVTHFDGKEVGRTPVSVSHKLSDGYVNITTDKWTETKPGYHAIICEGCGETHDAQPHVTDEDAWTLNGDQTFLSNGTESAYCLDCGAKLTRDVHGTADYNNTFANYHFLKVIFDYINLLLRIISNAGIN